MKLISAKCPNCGGHLKIEEGTTKTVCEYCNKDIIIDDESIKIKISGRVSVDGIKTDKELISSANELLDMGEYIKAKKLFDQFATNNPDQYQGWLGLLICRTRNFQIRDNNILFENDIEKYYKYYQRSAPQDVKDDYFETIDRYMYPDKWKEIDRQRELERQEEERQRKFAEAEKERQKQEEEREKKFAAAQEENKRLKEEKEKEREIKIKEYEEKMKNYVPGAESHVFLSILCYIHVAWTAFMAFAAIITPCFFSWILFNISAIIFVPPIRKIMVTMWKIPYWLIIIIRILLIIVSYIVLAFEIPPVYDGTWKSEDGMIVNISKNKVKVSEDGNVSEYKYKSILTDTGAYIIVLEQNEKNYKFVYYRQGNNIDFCLLDQDGNKCTKYLIPENPSSSYHYRTSE